MREHGSEYPHETATHAVQQALEAAMRSHDDLGARGLEVMKKNQFGDTALRADWEMEEAVLQTLSELGIPVRVHAEEHGIVDIGEPRLTAVLDGLDGTAVYKRERGSGRYGTMFGLFDGTDPSYDDYLVSGVMEHAMKRLFLATKGGGSWIVEGEIRRPVHTSGRTRLESGTKINIEEWFEINKQTFSQPLAPFSPHRNRPEHPDASCRCYVDVAAGADDLTLECTRKGNLEIAAAYGLIREAGGAIVDAEGSSIGHRRYLDYGQKEQVPIITAATPELAADLINYLRKNKTA